MIRDAIDRILDLKRETVVLSEGGNEYSTVNLSPIKDPLRELTKFASLACFVDFLNKECPENNNKLILSVLNPLQVLLQDTAPDSWGRLEGVAIADFSAYKNSFEFNKYLTIETFVIQVKTSFKQTPERDLLLKLVGNMKAGKVQTVTDDGVSQTVMTSANAGLVDREQLPSPLTLVPWRTFRDIEQVPSEFIVRVKQGDYENELPKIALFDVDDVFWRLEAINRIHAYLKANLTAPVDVYA